MAPQRLLEFTAGRACAHAVLATLGVKSDGIPVGPHREPQWPEGIVGSISHSHHLAIAVAAPTTLLYAIGIDIEPAIPLDLSLIDRVCTPAELSILRDSPDLALRAKLIFSAKESVYKCLWPATRQFLEFSDVEIALGNSDECFDTAVHGSTERFQGNTLSGRIKVVESHVLAAAYIEVKRLQVAPVDP